MAQSPVSHRRYWKILTCEAWAGKTEGRSGEGLKHGCLGAKGGPTSPSSAPGLQMSKKLVF
jgi:hypothetical protein